MTELVKTSQSRLFLIENRAGPANAPDYLGLARALGPSQNFGDVTPIRAPDPDRYGAFRIVDKVRGEPGLAEVTVQSRYQFVISDLLRIGRIGCPLDAQVHFGKCENPTDFNGGWRKIIVFEDATITQWSAGELGALEQSEDAPINEEAPMSASDMYEIKPLLFSVLGATEIVQEVVDVAICGTVQCGACGITSDGCSIYFALTVTAGGSPGLSAELIYTQNAGATLGQTNVDTLAANEDPDAMVCVGTNLVVVSTESCSLHYASIADILAGAESWSEVSTGFVCAAGAPNDIFSLDGLHTWIVGDGGYIYFTADPTGGVTVLSSGGATTQPLHAIHAIDDQNIVAVGASNAVVLSRDAGVSWSSLTGPAVGVILNTVWMRSENEWFVGAANGNLYYTRDGGLSWTTKTFPGSGTGNVRDIVFATPTIGYLAHSTTDPAGHILRTIDGGFSWYILPEGTTTLAENDYIGALAACGENPNIAIGGGLGANAADGFLVKAS